MTTNNNDHMRQSLVVSTTLHIALLLFLYFGLPSFYKPLPIISPQVPFQIVEIADLTSTRLQEPEQQTKPPAPEPKPAEKAQAQPQPQPQPQPPAPQVKQPEPLPKPQDNAEALKVKPLEKPKPPIAAQPHQDMLASVLKNVAKLKPSEAQTPDKKAEPQQQAEVAKSNAVNVSENLSISEQDALRRQIEQCWNPPVGARDAQNLIVEIHIDVNPDRTVQHAEVVDQSRMNDPYFRAAAESALRAVYNPHCSPLLLPADKYEQWKVIEFNFDPRDML